MQGTYCWSGVLGFDYRWWLHSRAVEQGKLISPVILQGSRPQWIVDS